jgi:hypothetical protein
MRATDLRIGNYVYWKGTETVITVKQIMVDQFDPIPLTPEWGRKFFEYTNGVSWCNDKDGFGIGLVYEDGLWCAEWNGNWLCNLDYVHELQNLVYDITKKTFNTKDHGNDSL